MIESITAFLISVRAVLVVRSSLRVLAGMTSTNSSFASRLTISSINNLRQPRESVSVGAGGVVGDSFVRFVSALLRGDDELLSRLVLSKNGFFFLRRSGLSESVADDVVELRADDAATEEGVTAL